MTLFILFMGKIKLRYEAKANTYTIKAHCISGAIIPALMHRIPSELRS